MQIVVNVNHGLSCLTYFLYAGATLFAQYHIVDWGKTIEKECSIALINKKLYS